MRARTTVTLPRTRAFPGGTIPGILLLGDLTWIEQAFGPALVRLHRDRTARVAAAVTPGGKPAPWMAREFPRLRGAAHLDVLDEPPDTLALIATPLRQRPAKITHALRRGWHVLSACPPAESAAETEKLCELARRNEVSLSVDLPHRLSPWFRWLRLIAGGRALGGCFTFRMEEGGEDIGPGKFNRSALGSTPDCAPSISSPIGSAACSRFPPPTMRSEAWRPWPARSSR